MKVATGTISHETSTFTTVASLPYAETKMTGSSASLRTSSISRMPSVPGSTRSSRTSPGLCVCTSSRSFSGSPVTTGT